MKELLPKIREAMNEPFVGNYVFSDEDLSQAYEFISCLLRNYEGDRGTSISQGYDGLLFVAMVNAVKEWKSDEDTFWECIYKKLLGSSEASQKVYAYLTGVIDRLGKHARIIYLSGCTKRYYATILAHAFAPLNSTVSFFELCWEVYVQDMTFTYAKNDETFSIVADELRRRFSNEKSLDDDFKLGSGVYFLRAGIKRLAIDHPKEMEKLIEHTIGLIHRMFEGEILSTNNNYYATIVKNWWIEKEKSFGINPPPRPTRPPISDYSTIRPKYRYNGQQAGLTIPSIRLKSNFYDMPYLNIYRHGEIIDRQPMYTFGSGLTMATKEMFLPVDRFVSEDGEIDCSIEIVHSGQIIYNSKKSLFREWILFRDRREIQQEECLPGNYILFAPKLEEFPLYPDNIRKVERELHLYVLQSREGELIQSPNRTVFFVFEKQKRSIKIAADRKSNAKFIHNGEEYIVIDGELRVVVEAGIDITKYGVRYESTDFRLCEFTCIENEGYRTFLITELLNVCEPQKINIFNYLDNKIEASYNVVKFNSICITYDRKLYFYGENLGNVLFHTEKYNKSVSFDIFNGDIIIPFDDGDIVLAPPVLRWKFGNRDFSIQYGEDLWYKDFSNSAGLIVDLPTEMGYQVLLSNNTVMAESSSYNSFNLGETIWSMLPNNDEITVFVKIENFGIVPIMNICLKEKFRFAPFIISQKNILWNASKAFVGDPASRFRITIFEDGTARRSFEIIENGETNYESRSFPLSEFEPGIYDVNVDLITKKGFMVEKAICLFKQQIVFGDINVIRFKGKYLRFCKVMLMGESSYEEIVPFYVDRLSYAGEVEGCHCYTGYIYIINRDGEKTYLNTMPNDQGSYDKINPIRIELRSENTCFIVYGVNPDDITDFWCEFTLDTKKRISAFDRNTRGINYYLFRTRKEK